MNERVGKLAVRYGYRYLRRRYRREIRAGLAVAAVGAGLAVYLGTRNVREG
ncbi:MAG TPA: hypothetical protein VEB65_03455 [Solirubrobacterales bacterium]|nr:hypothetical protein [Solirubrobacterales bacterium]